MKRIILAATVLASATLLAGCGSDGGASVDASPVTSTVTATVTETTIVSAPPTATPDSKAADEGRVVEPYFVNVPATTSCYEPCFGVRYRVSGFLPGKYTGSAFGRDSTSSVCNGDFGSGHKVTVGADGTGDAADATWFISGTCAPAKVRITVYGVLGVIAVPTAPIP